MDRLIVNDWQPAGPGLEIARVLDGARTPEGFSVSRLRSSGNSEASLDPLVGHLLSVTAGQIRIESQGLLLDAGSHVYLPPRAHAALALSDGAHAVLATAESPEQAVSESTIVRHERFLSACAAQGRALRWVLTPQYLSRRIFLHHDSPLVSREGRPISWFRTTMFDVSGLPANEDGESVFRMSYDTRTEFNVCYDVTGYARVRFARHPYVRDGQDWSLWLRLHSDATYHLDETEAQDGLRNRHEVAIEGGHCSLFCLFDPAPTGIERHKPGAYSDYEAYEVVSQRPEHARHVEALKGFDVMLDTLSRAHARGALGGLEGTDQWARFEQGRAAQRRIEAALRAELARDGEGRGAVLEPWMLPEDPAAVLP